MRPEQHEPKADECAPEIMGASIRSPAKHQHASEDKRRRDGGLIDDQQYLHDQRRPYIRPEYRCELGVQGRPGA